jgi:hypothetical protein
MARALSPSLLFLLFVPVIKAQETLLRKAFRLTLLCLSIVLISTTVTAQQLSDRAAITLKQGDVVDVVLQINTMGVGWCQVSFSTQSEPLGYVLCLGLEQNGVAPNHLVHAEAVATESPATSSKPNLSVTTVADSTVLTNKDILDMQKTGLPPEILVAKIKSSRCNFDTSPASLQALKTAGLGDSVILAMVEAPTGQAKLGGVRGNRRGREARTQSPFPCIHYGANRKVQNQDGAGRLRWRYHERPVPGRGRSSDDRERMRCCFSAPRKFVTDRAPSLPRLLRVSDKAELSLRAFDRYRPPLATPTRSV